MWDGPELVSIPQIHSNLLSYNTCTIYYMELFFIPESYCISLMFSTVIDSLTASASYEFVLLVLSQC